MIRETWETGRQARRLKGEAFGGRERPERKVSKLPKGRGDVVEEDSPSAMEEGEQKQSFLGIEHCRPWPPWCGAIRGLVVWIVARRQTEVG
jgi:hypothetical protein